MPSMSSSSGFCIQVRFLLLAQSFFLRRPPLALNDCGPLALGPNLTFDYLEMHI
jgi:hypothetical protein